MKSYRVPDVKVAGLKLMISVQLLPLGTRPPVHVVPVATMVPDWLPEIAPPCARYVVSVTSLVPLLAKENVAWPAPVPDPATSATCVTVICSVRV